MLANVGTFGDHVCPCGKDVTSQRNLQCATGVCGDCKHMLLHLSVCEGENTFQQHPVKFKWLRPIKIGNRNETEWAYDSKPYAEFITKLHSYYEDTYRLHNWVYKRQDIERHNNRNRLQKGQIILEFDYAAKATQFTQDCMPCSAARQTSNFVVFAHFDPTMDDVGNNIADTTEVFTFHSNCLTQDTHSIRRCLTHVLQHLQEQGHLKAKVAHFWADGCGAQNKGRKAFRQLSELSAQLSITILQNFPASHHFPGPWDTEGGRQTRAIKNHILNERDDRANVSVLDAGDNVRLLRNIMNKAGEPAWPVESQKMWRPQPDFDDTLVTTVSDVVPRSKPKQQARGRTVVEMEDDDTDWRYHITRRHIHRVEPCECHRDCDCPKDGRLTYKRDKAYDSSYIKGTMSTYCYAFSKKALHSSIRQYSCYCCWCARGKYNKCRSLHIVRHDPSKHVRPLDAGYHKWRDEGWRGIVQVRKSAPDRAVTRVIEQSLAAALQYVAQLPLGATVCVMTKKDDGSPMFWLAAKQSEVQVAGQTNTDTGVRRGESVLPIIWYDRLAVHKYVKLDDVSHVSVSSVIVTVSRIAWQKTTANRFYLGEHTHHMLMDLVNNISESE